MKVLHVVDRFTGFGVSHQLATLVECFDHSAAQHSICSVQDFGASVGFDFGKCPASSVHSLQLRSIVALSVAYRWLRTLRSLKPGSVHFWMEQTPIWMLRMSKAVGARTYVTNECQKTRKLVNRLQKLAVGKSVDRLMLPTEQAVGCRNNDDGRPCDVSLVPKPFIKIDPPSQDFRNHFMESIGCKRSDKLIVSVADLEANSRLKDPIWATDLLKCIRDDVHYVIVGQGRQKRRLQKYAFQASVGDYVHFVGERADAARIVAAADLYWASDSKQFAPDGLAWAMSSGTPVIAADSDNHRSFIEDGRNGILVRTGARDAYAKFANHVMDNPDQYCAMTTQAKQALSCYGDAQSVAKLIEEQYGIRRSVKVAA